VKPFWFLINRLNILWKVVCGWIMITSTYYIGVDTSILRYLTWSHFKVLHWKRRSLVPSPMLHLSNFMKVTFWIGSFASVSMNMPTKPMEQDVRAYRTGTIIHQSRLFLIIGPIFFLSATGSFCFHSKESKTLGGQSLFASFDWTLLCSLSWLRVRNLLFSRMVTTVLRFPSPCHGLFR